MPQTGGKGWGAIPAPPPHGCGHPGSLLTREHHCHVREHGGSRHAPQPSPTAARRWVQTRDARGLSLTA